METEVTEQVLVTQASVPKNENLRAAYVLSTIVAVIAAAVSGLGLQFPSVYRSTGWENGVLGNDLVTLVVAVPVLALAVIYSARGSVRARLVWLGVLYYMFYNYAFYVFGMPVTKLYLPMIAVFTVSGFALALGTFNLNVNAISRRFSLRTPARILAVWFLWVAIQVSMLWISQWVKFVFTGHVPEVNGSSSAYQVIAAVDLSFMVSLLIPAAYCLWRHRPWGYVFGGMLSVQGAFYTAVMAMVCVVNWKFTGAQLFSNWFIGCIVGCAVSLLCLATLLVGVQRAETITRVGQGGA
ncbi:MAG TPA: hypothetical protein VJ756_09385 [Terriglobales bacterium]|nr:hypothetical protein [Terriglobales bacterium]